MHINSYPERYGYLTGIIMFNYKYNKKKPIC